MRSMATFKRLWSKSPVRNFALLPFYILLVTVLVSANVLPDAFIDGVNLPQGDHFGISPSGSDQPRPANIVTRGEINPVAQKFATIPDADMPGYPDFSPLAKANLSYYHDPLLQIYSTKPMQGMYPIYRPVGNGYIGMEVAHIGPFFDRDRNMTNRNGETPREGWPLFNARQTFGTATGFYASFPELSGANYRELLALGDESVIAGIPHFLGLNLKVGNQTYESDMDLETITNFNTAVNMRDGINTWRLTWSPKDLNVSLNIEIATLVHRTRENIAATNMQVTAEGGDVNCTLIDIFDGRSAVRSSLLKKGLYDNSSSMYISLHPQGQPGTIAYMTSIANVSNGYTDESSRRPVEGLNEVDNLTIGQAWDVHLMEGKPAMFAKFVGIATTDNFPNDAEEISRKESFNAYRDGFDAISEVHTAEWNKRMAPHLFTSYRNPFTGLLPNDNLLRSLQAGAVSHRYNTLQTLRTPGSQRADNGVAVGGLFSDAYGGLKLWDQDVWMVPTIIQTDPHYARQILLSRTKHLAEAQANVQAAYVQAVYNFPKEAALYPWTAGKFSNATATGPVINYEYHANAGIALSMFQYLHATGDEDFFKEELWNTTLAVGHAFDTLMIPEGNGYSILNMTGPDEFHNNNKDGAYTLAAFSLVLKHICRYQENHGLPVNETWLQKTYAINVHKSASGITLEFEDMPNNITIKQADVIMMTHPLGHPASLQEQRENLLYYDQRLSQDGPAMSHAISAITTNRVAKSGCSAFTRQYKAEMPNLRAPWFLMSEQANDDKNSNGGTSPAFPFLTASGGSMQIPIYGYLGLFWHDWDVILRPSLPTPLDYLQLAEFYTRGNRFRTTLNSTHTNITRLPAEIPGIFDAFKNQPMTLRIERRNPTADAIEETLHSIWLNQTITVENDMYWLRSTIPNNILQCQPTSAGGKYFPAAPAGAATDGDPGTSWQPPTQNVSNITVNTANVPFQRMKKIHLDFGTRTPKYARVAFTNETDLASIGDANPIVLNVTTTDLVNDEVALHPGNITVLGITDEVWSGKFAILEIEGCQGCGDLVRSEKDPSHWTDDGLGATVAEFAAVGKIGSGRHLANSLEEETADDRQGVDSDIMDGQDAHISAAAESANSEDPV